ncbi:hypothetical protein D770_14580 [Flammeovirgaceae bacterium 311]|nr:hypothetical protein D770_14580 [Flammeovirgaceae bacterium 311]
MCKKLLATLILGLVIVHTAFSQQPERLRVSSNNRYLETESGKPFFWMGDTAWELFHRLTREEATSYLRNRAEKGFNVVQAVALAEMDGLRVPNPYGELPLESMDPARPRDAYFQHVDFIIKEAASLGMYIGLLPTWGDKVNRLQWGTGPEVFTPQNAFAYGKWLGNRYKWQRNIIWIIGGDRNPRDDNDKAIWSAMANGIAEGVGGHDKALFTYHPQPTGSEKDGGSADYFHQEEWLDFNMLQTGHCRDNNVDEKVFSVYQLNPVKPIIDGETIYEDIGICFNNKDLGVGTAYDVRKHAYLTVFAGAFGHTYGSNPIWQFYAPGRAPSHQPGYYWYIAMDLPGAGQMKYLRRLMESRPIMERVPDQSIIGDARSIGDRIQATRGKDYLMVYTTQGKGFTVNTSKISGRRFIAHWYNPKNGEVTEAGTYSQRGVIEFTPPKSRYGEDWVLVVDDASKNYSLPGQLIIQARK